MLKKVRGRVLEIDTPTPAERHWVFEALQLPEIYRAFGCREPVDLAHFRAHIMSIYRGGRQLSHEAVRIHILRRLHERRAIGFFIDFGWDYPQDSTRDLDLAFPEVNERGLDTYWDATLIVSQYMFCNGLAKRLRWRVRVPKKRNLLQGERWGARLLSESIEEDPVTHKPTTCYIYEFALADWQRTCDEHGWSGDLDYGDTGTLLWDHNRRWG
ncbi:MAG: hypothetical protein R3C68_07590 [Myxococcota bacterium]